MEARPHLAIMIDIDYALMQFGDQTSPHN